MRKRQDTREETRHTQYKRQYKTQKTRQDTRDKTRHIQERDETIDIQETLQDKKRQEPPNVRRHDILYSNLLWLDQG